MYCRVWLDNEVTSVIFTCWLSLH
uniref:Uncharacterized protein n=1 Tax=Arundo donax TaxID=35708 RepID=A0A0A9B5R3_ARUDO